jgi:hypothetical protein
MTGVSRSKTSEVGEEGGDHKVVAGDGEEEGVTAIVGAGDEEVHDEAGPSTHGDDDELVVQAKAVAPALSAVLGAGLADAIVVELGDVIVADPGLAGGEEAQDEALQTWVEELGPEGVRGAGEGVGHVVY